MTFALVDYHGHRRDVSDPQDAVDRFVEQADAIMPHGGAGQTIHLYVGDQPLLRVDIDVDAGRAALWWLPDGSHAVEFDPAGPIEVYESPDGGVREIPAVLARASAATARAAVRQAVATTARPTCVTWQGSPT